MNLCDSQPDTELEIVEIKKNIDTIFFQRLCQIGMYPGKIIKITKIQKHSLYFTLDNIEYVINTKIAESISIREK